jgi:hypothetical protein
MTAALISLVRPLRRRDQSFVTFSQDASRRLIAGRLLYVG